jgi:uncharacterized damage-inducible protein DinB
MYETTQEQYNWKPPGTANPIGVVFVHMLAMEDAYIQEILLAQPRLWEQENWEERLGTRAPWRGENWDEVKAKTLEMETVYEYQNSVRAATDAYIANLTPDELDRRVSFLGAERRVADVLAMLVVHNLGHAGEIAALKGIQGVQGLPF